MRRARYWGGGALLYLVFLAVSVPAEFAARFLPPQIAAEGVSGTLWHGGAKRVGLAGRGVASGPVEWRLEPWRLLLGEVALEAKLSGAAGGTLELAVGPRSIELRRVDADLPAAWLGLLVPRLEAWQLAGDLSVHLRHFTIETDAWRGQGEVEWRRAASGLSPVKPLGDYRAALSGSGSGIRFSLKTGDGPLDLAGEGEWSRQGLKFAGTARAVAREGELRGVLGVIGTPLPDGRYRVALGG